MTKMTKDELRRYREETERPHTVSYRTTVETTYNCEKCVRRLTECDHCNRPLVDNNPDKKIICKITYDESDRRHSHPMWVHFHVNCYAEWIEFQETDEHRRQVIEQQMLKLKEQMIKLAQEYEDLGGKKNG